MTINKITINDLITEAAEGYSWSLLGFLDYLIEEVGVPLDRIEESARKNYGIPSQMFWDTLEFYGYNKVN